MQSWIESGLANVRDKSALRQDMVRLCVGINHYALRINATSSQF